MATAGDKSVAKLLNHHRIVGLIASEWANLDLHLDLLIWKLAEVEQMLGACITTQLGSTSARFRTLIALLQVRDVPKLLLKKVRTYEGSTARTILKRNRAVHDTWLFDMPTDTAMQIQVAVEDKQLKMGIVPVKIDELVRIQKEITAHVNKVTALSEEIETWRASSSQKWRERLGHIQWEPLGKDLR